jgi:hypothetical protein
VQLHFTTRVRYGFLSVQLNYTIRLFFSAVIDGITVLPHSLQ